MCCDLLRSTARHDSTAAVSALRAHIHDIIRRLDDVQIVFYDDDCITAVGQPVQDIDELLAACVSYYKKTGRRISFEYTLISGKNDTEEDARLLASVLKNAFRGTGAPIHVNLIRVNEVKETGFVAGSVGSANAFADILNSLGVVATVRRRLGSDVNAACGQLRRKAMQNDN